MTNSVKKRTYANWCCGTNAIWKRDVNRSLRRVNKIRVAIGKEAFLLKEHSNLWSSPLDGGHYWYDTVRKRQTLTRCGHRRFRCFGSEWYEKAHRK